ncbi:hypothetical protein DID76_02855 [Candidatus Marinamargulisbacteria bacterium SCGC AG-414-C22]|nr:hypothetical protein DID76_02855 [Candidatus Marinamargulisbacteria bacterium SCGC AG-414-C22]
MIVSSQNAKIKFLRSLQRKESRYKHGVFLLENLHFIQEFLRDCPQFIQTLFYSEACPDALKECDVSDIECVTVKANVFNSVTDVKHSSGCVAVVKMLPRPINFDISYRRVLFLCDIQQPRNVGAIIRNAVAFGCDAIIVTSECADIYHPESIRASAGQLLKIPIYQAADIVIKDIMHQFKCYILDRNATKKVSDVSAVDKHLFVIGSEMGFSARYNYIIEQSTHIAIPVANYVDSLNVAVATGIVLYCVNEGI